ncbi:MAG: RNA polymerase sigma factor [Actinomycetia bacterium]|nr:RNA polymerase sigma factor [Actinomycetes bacterium]
MGDKDEIIYNTLSGELVRYASALVGPDDGPDLLSAVIARVLAKRRLSDLDDPRLYLFRAISNEAKSHKRRDARRQVVQLVVQDAVPEHEIDTALGAVMSLPAQQRSATYLVYWMGFTPTEAASAMGCRPATVRRYLHLARAKLEEVLDVHD